ncbi:hypothetical protein [Celeribacter baekdonensis]|jgi:hypothetical protein|nr:hypothetical protein [Celeribacter baekdonensis]|tara:strand:- start:418 stop:546 length:129 start_codon:yes stop_codon:yes gene_type:complete
MQTMPQKPQANPQPQQLPQPQSRAPLPFIAKHTVSYTDWAAI